MYVHVPHNQFRLNILVTAIVSTDIPYFIGTPLKYTTAPSTSILQLYMQDLELHYIYTLWWIAFLYIDDNAAKAVKHQNVNTPKEKVSTVYANYIYCHNDIVAMMSTKNAWNLHLLCSDVYYWYLPLMYNAVFMTLLCVCICSCSSRPFWSFVLATLSWATRACPDPMCTSIYFTRTSMAWCIALFLKVGVSTTHTCTLCLYYVDTACSKSFIIGPTFMLLGPVRNLSGT